MLVRVNKRIASPVVDYHALLSGTVSHVWHDEDSDSRSKPKRRNRIRVTREQAADDEDAPHYDA